MSSVRFQKYFQNSYMFSAFLLFPFHFQSTHRIPLKKFSIVEYMNFYKIEFYFMEKLFSPHAMEINVHCRILEMVGFLILIPSS